MDFDLLVDTPVMIDNKIHQVRFANGMTGIGSRDFWIDGKKYSDGVMQTPDITKGNHFLYSFLWRDNPWDRIYIFIAESELPVLLNEDESWRKPIKKDV
jgi:hypothetical protein